MKIIHGKYEKIIQQVIRNIDKFKHLPNAEIEEILENINTLAEIIYHQSKTQNHRPVVKEYLQAA